MHHFKDIITSYNISNVSINEMLVATSHLHQALDYVEDHDNKLFWKSMRCFHEQLRGPHFDEMYAKCQVASMYHTKQNGGVCRGEIYSMEEAKQIYEKYVRNIDSSYNCWDVYVAINAQFHDYSNLYKEWHSNITKEDLDNKIIMSAINFWFKDEDAGVGKVWNYFKNIG